VQHTLLLADDSVTIQRVIELTFADEDVRVVAVGDGDEAIAALDQAAPDIVLADVGMPGRNGYEVAQHIRDTPRLSHIPVLLLTGAFEPIDQARAADVGCAGVLAKPFEPQLVIGRVKELLARPKPTPDPLDRPLESAGEAASPWPSTVEEPVIHEPFASPAQADVDQYFDHLDRAFAGLSHDGGSAASATASSSSAAEQVDWFATRGPSQAPAHPDDHPSSAETLTAGNAATDTPAALAEPASLVELPPQAVPGGVALADAFAALLAAEQAEPGRAVESSAPPFVQIAPATPPIADDVIEEIVRRVLERLSDRVVRETVSDIVSVAAERVVRDEIERLKRQTM